MIKRISLILALILIFGVFAGCSGKKNKGDSASSGVSSGGVDTVVSVTTTDVKLLDENGESRYNVVRPDDSDITTLASEVFMGIKNTLGTSLKNVLDTNQDGTDAYEILVGNTNRPESQQALYILTNEAGGYSEDYIICTIGKKICINAYTNKALSAACTYFVNNIITPDTIKGGIKYVYKGSHDFPLVSVNGMSFGVFKIIRPRFNSSYLTQMELEKLQANILKNNGFELKICNDADTAVSKYEIIVGNTNREGVEKITNYDEYKVTIKGNKVFLNGGSPHSTAVAVTEFIKLLSKGNVTDADSLSGSYSATVATYDKSSYYIHAWGDDFDGDVIDGTKWDVITEEHYGKGADGLSGQNGKQALRVPEANEIKNGCLYQMQYYDDKAYYGGTIRSNNHMKFMGGYLEHSCITPDNPASWNTCWMSNVEDNGIIGPEIDLNENFGSPNVSDANAHVWPKPSAKEYGWEHRSFDHIHPNQSKYKVQTADGQNLNTGFHTFGFLWTEDYIAFTGDGEIYCDLDLNAAGYEDYKMAFTTVAVKVIIAASPGVGSGPKDKSSPEHWERSKSDYVTDYLHIYQLDDGWSRIEFDY